jgi:hypothetical protein
MSGPFEGARTVQFRSVSDVRGAVEPVLHEDAATVDKAGQSIVMPAT